MTRPLRLHMERLEPMVRRRKPTLYFVNSLSDVFLEDVPDESIALLFAAMACAPQHTFQVLTKRPERMQRATIEPDWWEMVWDAILQRLPGACRATYAVSAGQAGGCRTCGWA
jgi:protein gp37